MTAHGSLPRERRRELMERGRERGRMQLAHMREHRVPMCPECNEPGRHSHG